MKAVIHQPQYLPYPGFFHKLSLADVFVIMDDAQYDKRFTNRNKIITTKGWAWISVPIIKEHKFLANNLVKINNDVLWKEVHWKKIFYSYARSKFFHRYGNYFEDLYKRDWEFLFDLNFEAIKKIIEWLGIKIEIIRGSELKVNSTSTQRLIDVCKTIGADTYVSGSGGTNYMNEKLFDRHDIKLEYQHYVEIPYLQHLSEFFVPSLSIVDMLFNVGPKSFALIKEGQILEQKALLTQ